jgi:hypothetical protein
MENLRDSFREKAALYRRQMELIAARLIILPKGSIKPKKIGGETFFYLQYRRGKTVKSDYIGKSFPPALQENLSERKRLESELKQVREALKLLREKDDHEVNLVKPLIAILARLSREKYWDYGFKIIDNWCLLLYQRLLLSEKSPLQAKDLAILIPLSFRGKPVDFSDFFKNIGFKISTDPDGSIFFSGHKMKIGFLGPENEDNTMPPRSGRDMEMTPQLLNTLDILFEEPMVLKVAKGIRAIVPAPAAFTIHKLILATCFKRASMREKDIRQALYAGKYVLSEKSEAMRLARLWKRLPLFLKNKIERALADAPDIIPLEQESIRLLCAKLKKLPYK